MILLSTMNKVVREGAFDNQDTFMLDHCSRVSRYLKGWYDRSEVASSIATVTEAYKALTEVAE